MNKEVAIIGVGVRLPGIERVEDYWKLLEEEQTCIKDKGFELRWNRSKIEEDFTDWKMLESVGVASLIENVYDFDYEHFNMSKEEAKNLDPQARLLLEASYHALEDANIDPKNLKHSQTGVFSGSTTYDLGRFIDSKDIGAILGNVRSICANRLSYFYDFFGPSKYIDTACASSIGAIEEACDSLNKYDCNLALACGVNTILDINLSIGLASGGLLATDGTCRPFDQKATGYIRGEGAGVLILKRLEDAKRDKDYIYATISGVASGYGGRTRMIAQPSIEGIKGIIQKALYQGGLEVDDLDYIEANGSGTPLGDGIELRGINEAVKNSRNSQIEIGSVKANIGHCEGASGIFSLIKGLMVLNNQVIPATLNFENYRQSIGKNIGLNVVSTKNRQMLKKQYNIIGVNSYGIGGTTGFAILRRYENLKEKQSVKLTTYNRTSCFKKLSTDVYTIYEEEKRGKITDFKSYLLDVAKSISNIELKKSDFNVPIMKLGLDSIEMIQIRDRIQADVGVELRIVDFLKDTSLDDLIEYMSKDTSLDEEESTDSELLLDVDMDELSIEELEALVKALEE